VAGKLIVFDGVDRAGKSEMLRRVLEGLAKRGIDAMCVATDHVVGNYVPSLFGRFPDEIVYMLFWQAIREAELTKIQPALNLDRVVLVDRHVLSNLAYDWWKDLDHEFKSHVDELYLDKCLRPDLLFLFTIPYSVFAERDDGDVVLEQSLFEAIQQSFLVWGRQIEMERICPVVYVDGSEKLDVVFDRVMGQVLCTLSGVLHEKETTRV
jgi:dTMP kinase